MRLVQLCIGPFYQQKRWFFARWSYFPKKLTVLMRVLFGVRWIGKGLLTQRGSYQLLQPCVARSCVDLVSENPEMWLRIPLSKNANVSCSVSLFSMCLGGKEEKNRNLKTRSFKQSEYKNVFQSILIIKTYIEKTNISTNMIKNMTGI